jgi:hypothetical protein
MTDHAWIQEHIAAAVADGLTAEEAERFESHIRDCPECTAALADARKFDGKLGALFATVRPSPAFEDRTIQTLRVTESQRRLRVGWQRKLAIGIAASVGIGLTGVAIDQFLGSNMLGGQFGLGSIRAAAKPTAAPASPEVVLRTDNNNSIATAEELGVQLRNEFGGDSKNLPTAPVLRGEPDRSWDYQSYTKAPLGGAGNGRQKAATSAGAVRSGIADRQFHQPSADAMTSQQLDSPEKVYRNSTGLNFPNLRRESKPEDVTFGVPSDQSSREGRDYGYFKPDGAIKSFPPQVSSSPAATPTAPSTDGIFMATPRILLQEKENLGRDKSPPEEKSDKPIAREPVKESSLARKPEAAGPRKIIIRSGEMEFEVESFDSAVAAATRLVMGIDGAFVATINSEKLANGKVKGSIVLRVPPERLDALVLDLRKELGKGGELKGLRIGSQDITKQYTDLESRLRAARTMESRLLQIIKEGKGEIKQLLEAEKELGVWRTRIEEYEGELRFYGNQVALSTLTLTLAEKEMRSAATITENERVQAGIEVEDVDKALQTALAAITEAKGRVTKSELKQLMAGQFNATLHCEVAPEAAGPFRDRLSQLGRVARLEIDRLQQSDGRPTAPDVRTKRGDTQFLVQFYNLANVAPRETAILVVAVPDVAAGYQTLREAVAKAHGRVLTSQLDEQDRQNVTARVDFEVRRADEAGLVSALTNAGEVVSRNVTRAVDGDNLTDAKVLFRTTLVSAIRVNPRETTTLAVEVPDVDAAMTLLGAEVAEVKGRTVDAQAAHERAGRVTARLVYDVPLSAAGALIEKLKSAGIVRVQQSSRNLQAPDGRFATARLDVTLSNTDLIVAKDDGLWPQIRRGLSLSVTVLLMSVTWVVFGLCVVLPWAVVGYGGYRLFRRVAPRAATTETPATPAG